ncbi:hypothetical protein HELRODRAFT_169460 [Helobdella robusta]|uniref:EGF-like domain-containing protein n=1 Tax=Helobdella robusta TaxID=6412 RepID=T1F1Y9_HELRO|nr:hypothetical protein HELRODRAFT_169460 [Helobdella robusta]ESO08586.1 hypothetical protein HELRODRAFT_169460 [Helobdella robusta]
MNIQHINVVCSAIVDLFSEIRTLDSIERNDVGKQWFRHSGGTCSAHPLFDTSNDQHNTCLVSIDICCLAELRKQKCLLGRKKALSGEPCRAMHEDSNECCNCCSLGLKSRETRNSCPKLPRTKLFTCQCRESYIRCCNYGLQNKTKVLERSKYDIADPCLTSQHNCTWKERCLFKKSSKTFICLPIASDANKQLNMDGTNVVTSSQKGKHKKHPHHHKSSSNNNNLRAGANDVTVAGELEISKSLDHSATNKRARGNEGEKRWSRSSKHQAACRAGFQFNEDTSTCQDINECLSHINPCKERSMCLNTEGSYECLSSMVHDSSSIDLRHVSLHNKGQHDSRYDIQVDNEEQFLKKKNKVLQKHEHDDRYDSNGHYYNNGVVNDDHNSIAASSSSLSPSAAATTPNYINVHLYGKEHFNLNNYENDKNDEVVVEKDGEKLNACGSGFVWSESSGRCQDVDECETIRCPSLHMSCRNNPGSYLCVCNEGFKFNPRSRSCEDTDECQTVTHNCEAQETCVNTVGSFQCTSAMQQCAKGWLWDDQLQQCTDINECEARQHNCKSDEMCQNSLGSFVCVRYECDAGFEFNEESKGCDDVDECEAGRHTCSARQTCVNLVGSYVCRNDSACPTGYFHSVILNICQDVNECSDSSLHNCTKPNMLCQNRDGGFTCTCLAGYTYHQYSQICVDVDECLEAVQRGIHICPADSTCENKHGTFTCVCPPGFFYDESTQTCIDFDECAIGLHGCDQACQNSWGSYYCTCRPGYVLNWDGRTCTAGHASPSLQSYTDCPAGYTMNHLDGECYDTDECKEQRHTCPLETHMCVNTDGSFYCHPIVCPAGFHRLMDGRMDGSRKYWMNVDRENSKDQEEHNFIETPEQVVSNRNDADNFFYQNDSPDVSSSSSSSSSSRMKRVKRFLHSKSANKDDYSKNINSKNRKKLINFFYNISNNISSNNTKSNSASDSSGVVCKKKKCGRSSRPSDVACRSNSTLSIQWNQMSLASIPQLSTATTIINIQPENVDRRLSYEFLLVNTRLLSGKDNGNANDLFQIHKVSDWFGDKGEIYLLRSIRGAATYELEISLKTYLKMYSNMKSGYLSEHLMHIIIYVSTLTL